MKFKIFISGQKKFGEEILRLCLRLGFDISGVCCPIDDRYILPLAHINNIKIIQAGTLNADNFPAGVDLGITAHSFDYIGRRTRYKPRLGWLGYHPSLLPLHRGRSAVEWAIRMRDKITGGTIFWLNAGIDRGDIAYQDWCFIHPNLYKYHDKEAARRLWREWLLPMGVALYERALRDVSRGVITRNPQDFSIGSFEPSTDVKDVFKPDLLMLNSGK